MQQVIVDFGTLHVFGATLPLRVYGYGLMLVLGFLCGILLAQWRARRAGEDPEILGHCGILALIGGVGGARIAYVIENWRLFSRPGASALDILNVTSGGLIYYGGLILAMALVLGYLRLRRLPVRRYLDILAVSLMVGLAFGRGGCLLNGCCFGDRCQAGWALAQQFPMYCAPLYKAGNGGNPFSHATDSPTPVYAHQWQSGELIADSRLMSGGELIPPQQLSDEEIALAQASRSLPVKPAQALAIINALLLAGLLTLFYRLRTREGQVFALLLVLYPITRFLEEMIRSQPAVAAGLTHNQITSILMLLSAIGLWLWLRRRPASAGPLWAERLAMQEKDASRGGLNASPSPRARHARRRKP